LRLDVDVVEEVLPHVPVVAVDAVGPHRGVLVEIEGHDIREVESFLAMHADELAIHANWRAAGREPQDRGFPLTPAEMNHFRDSPRDYFGNVIVVSDDNTDSFTNLR